VPPSDHLAGNRALADRLRGLKAPVSLAVTRDLFTRHPEWDAQYGPRGAQYCEADIGMHLEFLAAAIEVDRMSSFEEYARWSSRLLNARGIPVAHLLETLSAIRSHLTLSLPPSEVQLIAALVQAAQTACSAPTALTSPRIGLEDSRSVYLDAILTGQRKAALTVAKEALRSMSIGGVYSDVLQEAMYEVGRLWESGRISVAIEHMATAITQAVMGQLYLSLPASAQVRGKVVVTGVQGELHQIGAHMVADVLEADGWDVRFLGTNMPHDGILKAIEDHRADRVCISTTMLFNVPKAIRLITDIRAQFVGSRILVGGAVFRLTPGLWQDIGADGFSADLKGCLDAANNLS